VHPGAFKTCTDGHFASGFHHAGGSAQALGVKLWVTHTFAVGLEIVQATARVLGAGHMAPDGGEQSLEFSSVEFFLPAIRPLQSSWCRETVQSFSEFAQVLFGMKAVDDLHGLRKLIFRDVPDPRSAVAEHHLAATQGLASDALGERRTFGSNVCCPSAL
jgi:hypothetical protein